MNEQTPSVLSSDNPKPNSEAPHSGSSRCRVGPFDINLPGWANQVIGALAVAGVGLTTYFTVVQPHLKKDAENQAKLQQTRSAFHDPAAQHIPDQNLLASTESAKHFDEPRKTSQAADGKLSVDFFASDGCVRASRRGQGPTSIVWLPDPARIPKDPAPGRIDEPTKPVAEHVSTLLPSLYAAGQPTRNAALCGGRCPPQHAGQFETRTGERRGCWLQVWRRWPDGCQHYQWFNTCYSYWDEDNSHRPRIYWTCCNH